MSECSGSIDSVKRVKLILNDEEELVDVGLTSGTTDKQTSTGKVTKIQRGARGVTLFDFLGKKKSDGAFRMYRL